jgi:putative heme-binding domain-containing protein
MMDSIGYGRIYRIVPKGSNPKSPVIDFSTTKGQIEALLNPAVNVRTLGFEKLRKQGESVLNEVEKVLESDNPYHRARAVWLLGQLGKKGVKLVEYILRNEPDPRLRVTAYRVLKANKERIMDYAMISIDDPSPAVRREIAISLRDVSWGKSQKFIDKLFQGYDGNDRWYLEALGTAMDGKEEQAYRYLLRNQPENPNEWSDKFASLVWRLHPTASIPALKERALSDNVPEVFKKLAVNTLAFINDQDAVAAMLDIRRLSGKGMVRKLARYWIDFRKTNDWLALWNWGESDSETIHTVPKQIAIMKGNLLDNSLSLDKRVEAAKAMVQSSIGGHLLIQMAANDELSKKIIDAVSYEIFNSPEIEVRTLAGEYFNRPDVKKLSVSDITLLKGDIAEGKKIFDAKCATCHKVGEKGENIGPTLSSIGEKFDKKALLDAIINPNAAIVFGYEPMLIKTKNGQALSGFLLSEGETTTIKDMRGNQTTLKSEDIVSKQQMKTGIMPDAVALGLSEEDLAHLTNYLLTLKRAD